MKVQNSTLKCKISKYYVSASLFWDKKCNFGYGSCFQSCEPFKSYLIIAISLHLAIHISTFI
jgi:hypothetical protein